MVVADAIDVVVVCAVIVVAIAANQLKALAVVGLIGAQLIKLFVAMCSTAVPNRICSNCNRILGDVNPTLELRA